MVYSIFCDGLQLAAKRQKLDLKSAGDYPPWGATRPLHQSIKSLSSSVRFEAARFVLGRPLPESPSWRLPPSIDRSRRCASSCAKRFRPYLPLRGMVGTRTVCHNSCLLRRRQDRQACFGGRRGQEAVITAHCSHSSLANGARFALTGML